MSLVASDPRFRVLRDALGDGPVPDEIPTQADARMEAAVSLVLRARDPLDLLLIKRATSERDRWSGQMALPGGRWEPHDQGLLHTAKRETLEETGIDLDAAGASLGRLVDVSPVSHRLPRMRVAPFVFGVPGDTRATVASPELESVHWVPVPLLLAPETATTVEIRFPESASDFPSYHVVGEHVWGLTHRILTSFFDLYPHTALSRLAQSD